MASTIRMATAAALTAAILAAGTAAAQEEPLPAGDAGGLQLTERDFFVGFGLGFTVGFNGGATFRLEEFVGYHLLNVAEHPGLYVAFAASQLIAGGAILNFAGRVGFDLLLWSNAELALLLNPSLQLGGAVFTGGLYTYGAFYMHPSVELSLALLQGLLHIFWRPLGFDIWVADTSAAAYSMLFGLSFWF